MAAPHHVLALDVGTTSVRAILFRSDVASPLEERSTPSNQGLSAVASASRPVVLNRSSSESNTQRGRAEYSTVAMWAAVVAVLRECVKTAFESGKISSLHDICALGISAQRGTFTCWETTTGQKSISSGDKTVPAVSGSILGAKRIRESEVRAMKVAELKEVARELGLPVSGTKGVLSDRIVGAIQEQAYSEQTHTNDNGTASASGNHFQDVNIADRISPQTSDTLFPLISWQDVRSATYCDSLNQSILLKGLRSAAAACWFVVRNQRLAAATAIRYSTVQACVGLGWAISQNLGGCADSMRDGKLRWGTIDCWLLHRLTGGTVWATDFSNISATGFWDPFNMEPNAFAFMMTGVKQAVMPEVRDTAGDFGKCVPELFQGIFDADADFCLPIAAVAADQHAALFGHGCFAEGDVKVTLGTGAFVDINTGNRAVYSPSGYFPLVGWKIRNEPAVFMLEGQAKHCGSALDWAVSVFGPGVQPSPVQSAAGIDRAFGNSRDPAASKNDAPTIVPCFGGLGQPYRKDGCSGIFTNLTTAANAETMLRSLCDGVALQTADQLLHLDEDQDRGILELSREVKFDGGVTHSAYIMQTIADASQRPCIASSQTEMTAQGAAMLAGIACGLWENMDEMAQAFRRTREYTRYDPFVLDSNIENGERRISDLPDSQASIDTTQARTRVQFLQKQLDSYRQAAKIAPLHQ